MTFRSRSFSLAERQLRYLRLWSKYPQTEERKQQKSLLKQRITVDVFEMSEHDQGFKAALEEAKAGAKEGGIPIGACLVDGDGKILGRGHNMRVQKSSAILHVCTSLHHVARANYYTYRLGLPCV